MPGFGGMAGTSFTAPRLPGSEVDLLGNGECVIDVDAEEPDRAVYLGERVGPGDATATAGWSF